MKILNLFAGIGGNRTLWGDEHEITAVEYEEKIARIYWDRFPTDKVIVEDAYIYLENHYKEFDFIWASPPCQSHTTLVSLHKNKKLADMRLYSMIVFLKTWFKGNWLVENVQPYYKPLIKESIILDRHYFWCNFPITKKKFKRPGPGNIKDLPRKIFADFLCIELTPNIKQVHLRNCVIPEIGKYILDSINTKTLEEFL